MGVLDGKVALITGAGAGIGRGIARRFAREGAAVVIAEINEDAGLRTKREIERLGGHARFVHTDVTSKAAVYKAVESACTQFGRLDVLVNNAITLSPNVLLE